LLVPAIIDSLRVTTDQFPHKFVEVAMFTVTDQTASPPLWQDVNQAIASTFDGVSHPKIGYFEENLAASKDASDTVTGTPSTAFAAPLAAAATRTFTMFQMLEGWTRPFANPSKVAGTTPIDAMNYARTT
jgi:hypothetical protein